MVKWEVLTYSKQSQTGLRKLNWRYENFKRLKWVSMHSLLFFQPFKHRKNCHSVSIDLKSYCTFSMAMANVILLLPAWTRQLNSSTAEAAAGRLNFHGDHSPVDLLTLEREIVLMIVSLFILHLQCPSSRIVTGLFYFKEFLVSIFVTCSWIKFSI